MSQGCCCVVCVDSVEEVGGKIIIIDRSREILGEEIRRSSALRRELTSCKLKLKKFRKNANVLEREGFGFVEL